MRILLATTNPHKVKEIRELLTGLPVDLTTLARWPDVAAPEETGATFEENARAKARPAWNRRASAAPARPTSRSLR